MARNQYSYEKHRREIAKKKKKEEKRQRKLGKGSASPLDSTEPSAAEGETQTHTPE